MVAIAAALLADVLPAWLVDVLVLLLGLAFGSFANVCATRLPRGESIALPRSHCRNCPHPLSAWENLPLLGWLLLRGRCRKCRSAIGWRYPAVEAAIALLWLAGWVRFGLSLAALQGAVFCWLSVALCATDAELGLLPDWLTLPGTAIGLGFAFAIGGLPMLLHHAIAAAAGVALLLAIGSIYRLLRHREGMGLGDVKMLALCGAFLGVRLLVVAFFAAVFSAALAGLAILAIGRIRRNTRRTARQEPLSLPFGCFLALGATGSLFFGTRLLLWYVGRFF